MVPLTDEEEKITRRIHQFIGEVGTTAQAPDGTCPSTLDPGRDMRASTAQSSRTRRIVSDYVGMVRAVSGHDGGSQRRTFASSGALRTTRAHPGRARRRVSYSDGGKLQSKGYNVRTWS